MGLAVSVRGVNGFRLSRKRLHDSGDLRTKIAWCSPESISPQIPMSAHGTKEKSSALRRDSPLTEVQETREERAQYERARVQ
jgi:hypothetical protein